MFVIQPPRDRQHAQNDCGVIRADEAYTTLEFSKRTGLGSHAIRHAELAGLRVAFVSKRKYILGASWIELLRSRERSRKDTEHDQDHDREDEGES